MTTAVAPAIAASLPNLDRHPSPRGYPPLAPTTTPSIERDSTNLASDSNNTWNSPTDRTPSDGKKSPRGGRPKPIVKKEPPTSPALPTTSKHRPRKLDLQTSNTGPQAITPRPSITPMTARDGLAMQDVGLACISPGFQTQDPTMREQLQRSLSVRDQQRSIIESRLLKSAKGDGSEKNATLESVIGEGKPTGKKRQPPAGLSIVPPPAQQFANERVIQSAPLHQSFTGRHQQHPASRQIVNQPTNLASSSSIHHVPAIQTNNRLPPISDVFGAETLNPNSSRANFARNSSSSNGPPLPSPGFPPRTAHPMSQGPQQLPAERPREYRSAEEAVHDLTGGREDLLPKIVHYSGHQPPTPPSPRANSTEGLTPHKFHAGPGAAGRRRSRNEYEADSSPPLGTGRDRIKYGPFGEGRDSPATQRAKKEEFLTLCSRAWDLFHS